LPTVFELLGFELLDGDLPGQSLLSPVADGRRLYHATWIENQSMALRVGSRKYVYHYRRKPMEVFDLSVDPFERNDIAATIPPGELKAVELELLVWRNRVNMLYD
jgi:hypothetical protein